MFIKIVEGLEVGLKGRRLKLHFILLLFCRGLLLALRELPEGDSINVLLLHEQLASLLPQLISAYVPLLLQTLGHQLSLLRGHFPLVGVCKLGSPQLQTEVRPHAVDLDLISEG